MTLAAKEIPYYKRNIIVPTIQPKHLSIFDLYLLQFIDKKHS